MNDAPWQEIYYEVSRPNGAADAAGVPVILVHGLAASLYDWVELTPALTAAGYTCFALDLPGHGKSVQAMPPGGDHLEQVFASFCQWIDSLELSQPLILVGHSLGGYLSLRYALLHPGRVRGLLLCNPFFDLHQLPAPLRLNYRYSLINTTLIGHLPEWLIHMVITTASKVIRNGYELPEDVQRQTAADYKRARPEIFNLIKGVTDLSDILPAIRQPVLVVWGARDLTLAPASFHGLVSRLGNATAAVVAGAGHVPHQSHAPEFNALALKFLRELGG